MKTAVAVLLCSTIAFGQADAPLLNPHAPGRSMHLTAGETTPISGQMIEDTEHSRREWNTEKTAGELAKLKEDEGKKIVSVPVLIAIIAGSIAVGCAVGVATTLVLKR